MNACDQAYRFCHEKVTDLFFMACAGDSGICKTPRRLHLLAPGKAKPHPVGEALWMIFRAEMIYGCGSNPITHQLAKST